MAAMSRLTHFVKLTLSGNEDHRVSNTVERMGAPQISPSDST